MTHLKHWFALLLGCTLLGGCNKAAHEAQAPKAAESAPKAEESGLTAQLAERRVKLSPDNVEKMGIVVTAAATAQFLPETQGFGVVVGHEPVAQAVAEVATAQAASRQSQAVLARIERLSGTAGADTAEARENAQRQAATDNAALLLAQRRLSTVVGQRPPWARGSDGKMLEDLAKGGAKLLHVTFPLGTLKGGAPHSLRVARLDAPGVEEQWRSHTVWDAPADAAVPGRAFFALLQDSPVAEGERLVVWAAGSDASGAVTGALVPASAALVSDGRYWCYVERAPGDFERVALDISRPLADGYVVLDAIKPGERIVSAGAGLLLARETNPSRD